MKDGHMSMEGHVCSLHNTFWLCEMQQRITDDNSQFEGHNQIWMKQAYWAPFECNSDWNKCTFKLTVLYTVLACM